MVHYYTAVPENAIYVRNHLGGIYDIKRKAWALELEQFDLGGTYIDEVGDIETYLHEFDDNERRQYMFVPESYEEQAEFYDMFYCSDNGLYYYNVLTNENIANINECEFNGDWVSILD